jgi:CIC family chloride channel protein
LIFIVIILRIIATSISIYANAVGGIFVALMSIGALVGYGFGELMVNLGFKIEPFYFAAIGAAVFMGVNMKLPLTAIVMALEITYDYNVLVPTGISVVIVSYLTSLQFNIKKLKFKGLG